MRLVERTSYSLNTKVARKLQKKYKKLLQLLWQKQLESTLEQRTLVLGYLKMAK